ncbi:hypothetical protein MA16_Dca018670 [Dendrobium catenatum]|uniref:Uncharacterized protein n=1 Tax=Dendrobium catenatum TaxID=906689 RepID=A0A2I0X1C9_9ASPA|nr:hypothetical protein MA16_Dca018670 [Dendrobium catenatum]
MKKIFNMCSKIDVKDSHVKGSRKENPPSNTNVEDSHTESPQSNTSRRSDQVIHARKNGDNFRATKARFSAGGNQHIVDIIFERTDQGSLKMSLFIDGERLYMVYITSRKTEGNAEFNIDGMAVDLFWDLKKSPMRFLFRTKIVGGGGSEIYEESSDWVEGYYTLLILGVLGVDVEADYGVFSAFVFAPAGLLASEDLYWFAGGLWFAGLLVLLQVPFWAFDWKIFLETCCWSILVVFC